MELSEHIVDDLFLSLFIEHPDAEVLGMILGTEFRARQPQQRQSDLVTVFLVVILGHFDDHIREK